MATIAYWLLTGDINLNETVPGPLDTCKLNQVTGLTVTSNGTIMVATLNDRYTSYNWNLNQTFPWELSTKIKPGKYNFDWKQLAKAVIVQDTIYAIVTSQFRPYVKSFLYSADSEEQGVKSLSGSHRYLELSPHKLGKDNTAYIYCWVNDMNEMAAWNITHSHDAC